MHPDTAADAPTKHARLLARRRLMGETMHRVPVHDQLIVCPSVPHFLGKRRHVRHRPVRVERTVADQNSRPNRSRFGGTRCLETSVDTDDAADRRTAARVLEDDHCTEAIANCGHATVDLWTR